MKITEHIQKASKALVSFEILPPKKGEKIDGLFQQLDQLMEFHPPFIAVTYHREEYIVKKLNDGTIAKFLTKRRPGTVGICAAIQNKYNVDAVPHIICGGFTREETESALIDLHFLGIDNVLILRGDPIKSEKVFIPTPQGHHYASELLNQVVNMNKGCYLHEEIKNANKTDFCKGVAAYPEKHSEAISIEEDIKYLKQKADMGAEYALTQMFFDNEKYLKFIGLCKNLGVDIPIIPGLKPISTFKQYEILPKIFHINIPEALTKEIKKCKTDMDVKQVGIEWCIQQSKELIQAGVPIVHYYTMGRAEPVHEIVSAIF